jgi:hypothetical protein
MAHPPRHSSQSEKNLGFTIASTIDFEHKPHQKGIPISQCIAHPRWACVFLAREEEGKFDDRFCFFSICNQ